MPISQTLTAPCPGCQTPNVYEQHASLELDGGPVTRSLLTNLFNVYRCAGCGLQRRIENDLLVVDRAKDAYFQVIVRDEEVAPYIESFRQLAPGARLRVVNSRDALVEKVRLWVLGLDDVAYECVKLAMRINQRDLEGKLVLRFDRVQDEQLLFVSLKSEGPPDVLPMPMHVYHRMASQLNTAACASEPEVDERLARRLLGAASGHKGAPGATEV